MLGGWWRGLERLESGQGRGEFELARVISGVVLIGIRPSFFSYAVKSVGAVFLSIDEPDIYLHADLLRQLVAVFRDPALESFLDTCRILNDCKHANSCFYRDLRLMLGGLKNEYLRLRTH
jgi:hypothetical protein